MQCSPQSSTLGSYGKRTHEPSCLRCSRHSLGVGYLPTVGLPTLPISSGTQRTACLAPIGTERAFPCSHRHVLRLGRRAQGPISPGPFPPSPVVSLPIAFEPPRPHPYDLLSSWVQVCQKTLGFYGGHLASGDASLSTARPLTSSIQTSSFVPCGHTLYLALPFCCESFGPLVRCRAAYSPPKTSHHRRDSSVSRASSTKKVSLDGVRNAFILSHRAWSLLGYWWYFTGSLFFTSGASRGSPS